MIGITFAIPLIIYALDLKIFSRFLETSFISISPYVFFCTGLLK